VRGVLQVPVFRRLWLSNFANDFGDQFARLGLSVTAVLVLHASAFQVAVVTALNLGAYLVFGMPVGVWVDRWRRRPVLIAAELVRAAAILSIPLVYLAGDLTIWQVMAVAGLVSTAGVFFETAHIAILPSLVGRDQVSEANARLQTSDTTMRVVGPALAGEILRVTTGPLLYVATAAMSLVSAGLITTMKIEETTPAKGDREPFRKSVTVGIRFVTRHPVLHTFMFTSATVNLGAGVFIAVLPVFVLRDLGMTPQAYGIAVSIGAVGGMVGSFVGLRIKNMFGEVRAMLLAQCGFPLAFAALPLALYVPVPAGVLVGISEFLFGLALVVHSISSTGIRARVTPHHLMGRVSAASRFVTLGAVPVGSLLGGAVGTWLGLPTALFLSVALAMLTPVIMRCSPVGHLQTVPIEWEAEHWETENTQ